MPSPAPLTEEVATQRIGVSSVDRDGPVTERIAVAQQRSIAGGLIALALLVALGVGIAVGYAQSDGDDDGVLKRALIGPNGGAMGFEGGGKIQIPAGALPTATSISVRKVTNENRVRLGPEGDAGAKIYEPGELTMYAFEPSDLRLQQPAKVTLPRPSDGTALLIDTPQGLRVVGAEAKGKTVTFETTSFSFEDL